MNWRKYLKSRVLIARRFTSTLYEAYVEEVSPSGRVKFKWTNDTSCWYDADEYRFVEALSDVNAELSASLKKILNG